MSHHIRLIIISSALLIIASSLIACSGRTPASSVPTAAAPPTVVAHTAVPPTSTSIPAPAPTNTPVPAAAPTSTPEPQPTPAPANTPAPAASSPSGSIFTLEEGSIARYKVEEVLVRTGFKIATGETSDVSGSITFAPDGSIIPEQSSVTVQAATLRTDSDRRDGYVRKNTLLTDQYPEIIFRPTSADGLPTPLADAQGSADFTITGDLTIRDQTREITWNATADFDGSGGITGMANTEFTFDDFGMDKPSVPIVFSVEDTIRLELDFTGSIQEPTALNTNQATNTAQAVDNNNEHDNDHEPTDEYANAHTLGSPDALVTVVEYSDFQ